jgi:hypothetical protein
MHEEVHPATVGGLDYHCFHFPFDRDLFPGVGRAARKIALADLTAWALPSERGSAVVKP